MSDIEQKASELLKKIWDNFSYADLHTYTEYLIETDDPILKNNGIICILRILGDRHQQTRELFQKQLDENKERITRLEYKQNDGTLH